MQELRGKVAVVTGAASGLGLGLATRLMAIGAAVVLADIEEGALSEVGDALRRHGRVLAVPTDVSDARAVADLRRRTEASFGPAHLVFNNAGVSPPPGPTVGYPAAAWQWAFEVNLGGVLHGIREFVPGMIARREGHVINTASFLGVTSGGYQAAYSASKAAVIAVSLALQEELAESGVRVSIVFAHVASRISSSRRNWLSRLGDDPWATPDAPPRDNRSLEIESLTDEYVASGMDPVEAADQVVAAVLAGELWVIPGADAEARGRMLHPRWPEV
jgi:NADP-dependent 3-hydroxy acid dehydrogenase YdfG